MFTKRRRRLLWMSAALLIAAICAFSALAFVLDPDPVEMRLLNTKIGHNGLLSAYSDEFGRIHIYEEHRLVGVIRGHNKRIVSARFLSDTEIQTADRDGARKVTNLKKLDRLPIVERAHLKTVRESIWIPYGRP